MPNTDHIRPIECTFTAPFTTNADAYACFERMNALFRNAPLWDLTVAPGLEIKRVLRLEAIHTQETEVVIAYLPIPDHLVTDEQVLEFLARLNARDHLLSQAQIAMLLDYEAMLQQCPIGHVPMLPPSFDLNSYSNAELKTLIAAAGSRIKSAPPVLRDVRAEFDKLISGC